MSDYTKEIIKEYGDHSKPILREKHDEFDYEKFRIYYPYVMIDKDYKTLDVPPKEFYLPELIVTEGTHYLTGKVKQGKSVFVLGLTEELTDQGVYVYYYSAEDDDSRMKVRLEKIREKADGRLLIATRYGKDVPTPEKFLKHIEEMATEFPQIKVFIFDTARFAVAKSKITKHDAYEGNYNEITPWNNLAHKLGLCFIMIGHNNQNNDAEEWDHMHGGTGITAAYENLIMLRRHHGNGESKMLLHTQGKDLTRQTRELEEVKDENGIFVRYNIGQIFDAELQGSMKELLINLVKDSEEGSMTKSMFINKLTEMNRYTGNLRRDLGKLVKSRNLEKAGDFYRIPPLTP